MQNTKASNAYRAALALMASSTSGWTWDKAVWQVMLAFDLTPEETRKLRYFGTK